MTDDTIKIYWSANALARAHVLLEGKDESYGLRLFLTKSGCAGWSYALQVAQAPAKDELVLHSSGVRLFVPKVQRHLLDGTHIDYVKEGMNRTFSFRHPAAREVCGCGESFTLEISEEEQPIS